MAIKVFAWPPVCTIGRSWVPMQPVAALRSALTGREQMQSSQRLRRMVAVDVPARYRSEAPASGYMDMLVQLLEGNVNAVRLSGWASAVRVGGEAEFGRLTIGLTATATTSAGFGAWQVDGLPPQFPLVLAGDRFTVAGTLWRAINAAQADASGRAIIRVMGAPSGSGTLLLDQKESAVFRVDGAMPPSAPQVGSYTYSWSLREIFADEVGGFTEVNPWI